jgi:hypothetical protein
MSFIEMLEKISNKVAISLADVTGANLTTPDLPL